MDLSIIIVNWRSLQYLRACLSALYRMNSSDLSYEIIVVDNDSGDDCDKSLSQEFPHVSVVLSPTNVGFGKANNLGYLQSSGDIVLFLNPDTEVSDNVIVRMVHHLHHDPSVGAVGARLLNTDGSLQTSCVQAFPTVWNQMLDSELLQHAFPMWRMWGIAALFEPSQRPSDVEAISGACFMVKRAVFEQVGRFTETYFMYVEDVDLSYKIVEHGYRIQYLPSCVVVHHGGRSSSQRRPGFANRAQKESYLRFFRHNRGASYATLYRITQGTSAIGRMAALVVMILIGGRLSRSDYRLSLAKWWETLEWAIGLDRLRQDTAFLIRDR
jgi:N-acetylglucosaminyl-diphospho-decaprenol L-rhamnosyltransferase